MIIFIDIFPFIAYNQIMSEKYLFNIRRFAGDRHTGPLHPIAVNLKMDP